MMIEAERVQGDLVERLRYTNEHGIFAANLAGMLASHGEAAAAIQSLTERNDALARGIAKEVARAVLSEGMTTSRLFMAGTLRSWLHYCALRCDRKTQKEHRRIAEAWQAVLIDQFPDLADVILPSSASVE